MTPEEIAASIPHRSARRRNLEDEYLDDLASPFGPPPSFSETPPSALRPQRASRDLDQVDDPTKGSPSWSNERDHFGQAVW